MTIYIVLLKLCYAFTQFLADQKRIPRAKYSNFSPLSCNIISQNENKYINSKYAVFAFEKWGPILTTHHIRLW